MILSPQADIGCAFPFRENRKHKGAEIVFIQLEINK